MKQFPFKRQLIILACIITALCVAIPVAAFAKQSTPPPGAGEHHVSVQHSLQAAASGQPVTITADCGSPQPIVTFNTGDTVSGTAVIVTSSGDPAEEAGEHEDLQLGGTNVPTIPGNPFAVDSGTHPINFKATGSGTLTGCITVGVNGTGFDNDESATVTVTVTPAPTPTPPPPTPVPTPTPLPPVKQITNIGGSASTIFHQVDERLEKFGNRLVAQCTIALFTNGFTLFALEKRGLRLVQLDFTVITKKLDVDQQVVEGLIAAFELLPGSGCAEEIVNIISNGGIDLLKDCLRDRGCLTQIEHDKQLRNLLCAAVTHKLEVFPPPALFPDLFFEYFHLCV